MAKYYRDKVVCILSGPRSFKMFLLHALATYLSVLVHWAPEISFSEELVFVLGSDQE